jgi:hypothetical protein
MLHVINIRVNQIETTTDYVKKQTLTETQIVDATTEEDAIDKLQLFYNEKQTDSITYEFTIQSINPIII